MKQTVLALLAMAAVTAMSIATADAKTIHNGPASNIDDDYYDSGCHTVISHHYAPGGGEATEQSRTCS
jgi:hypothetical protein